MNNLTTINTTPATKRRFNQNKNVLLVKLRQPKMTDEQFLNHLLTVFEKLTQK